MITLNEKRDIFLALTRHNYFPNQKEYLSELPPCFSTRQYTPEVCDAISQIDKTKERKSSGFDLVEFRATRYNNVSRTLSLIHPKPYSDLVCSMINNWESLRSIMDNEVSQIKPEIRQDGRAFVMNYEEGITKKQRIIQSSFGKKVVVSTDIANCFNSIYSHSIPWALVGIEKAKANRSNKEWFNQIDMYARSCKRNETLGVPIGSGTSSVIVETILSIIDDELKNENFEFERYVDDYTCYCENDSQAESFIISLEAKLSAFKLSLNLNKTTTTDLPHPHDDDWVLELMSCLPNKTSIAIDDTAKEVYLTPESLTFLNNALRINKETPDGSVLKYAIQLISSSLDEVAARTIFLETLNLSWHYPILVPFLEKISSDYDIDVEPYEEQLNKIIIENASKRRSDGMCWPLHIMFSRGLTPSKEAIKATIQSRDCLAVTLIFNYEGFLDEIKQLIVEILNADIYTKDNYWLLLYQLYYSEQIESPYEDGVFECLKQNQVHFIPSAESKTNAEMECEKVGAQIMFGSFPVVPALAKE